MQEFTFESLGFNPDEVEAPADSYELLPAGWYSAMIIETDLKPNNAGTGHLLALRIEITGPTQAGRLLFENLNLDNPNPTAVKIARETLKKICDVLRVTGKLTDPAKLQNLPMLINVGIAKRKDTGEMENKIKQFKSYDVAAGASAPVAAPAPAQAPAPAPAGAPPWASAQ